MSGLPNPQQAEELAQAFRDIDAIDTRLEELQRLTKESETLMECRGKRREQAQKLLEAMDCAHPGNFGYERRMFALLAMLARASQPEGLK